MRTPNRTEALLTLSNAGKLQDLRDLAAAHGYRRAIDQALRSYRRSGAARQQTLRPLLRHLFLAAEATADWPRREEQPLAARRDRDQFVRADFRSALQDTIDRRIRPALKAAPRLITSHLFMFTVGWGLSPILGIYDRISRPWRGSYGEFYWQNDDRSW